MIIDILELNFTTVNFAFTKICKQLRLQREAKYPQIEQFWFQIFASTFIPEAVAWSGSVEKVLPATLLKGGSGAGVFL